MAIEISLIYYYRALHVEHFFFFIVTFHPFTFYRILTGCDEVERLL